MRQQLGRKETLDQNENDFNAFIPETLKTSQHIRNYLQTIILCFQKDYS